jgi:hypothetical protein
VHFDVIFIRLFVFANISFGFYIGKRFCFFRIYNYPEYSLVGGFDVGKARVSSLDFLMCYFDIGFQSI